MSKLFRFSIPRLRFPASARTAGVYISGGVFALGMWFFLDAAIYSKVRHGGEVHVNFIDWTPGIASCLGMLIINSIDKTRLTSDSFGYTGSGVAWKIRFILFMGFAFMAGGLAGSVVVLVLKYIMPEYPFPTLYFGIANVIANGLIMLSSMVLWIAQNIEDDYQYNLAL